MPSESGDAVPGRPLACRRHATISEPTPMNRPTNDSATHVVIDARTSCDDEFGTVVVTAIADELGVDPESLPPIRDSIDPDILNGLREDTRSAVTSLTFEYLGYEIVEIGRAHV